MREAFSRSPLHRYQTAPHTPESASKRKPTPLSDCSNRSPVVISPFHTPGIALKKSAIDEACTELENLNVARRLSMGE
eukprot:scaffold192721_cov46-Prasinocladus_malaysianus.AAC.1